MVKELQETLAPELEMIESRIIRPSNELLARYQGDPQDRYQARAQEAGLRQAQGLLKKLQEKKDRSAKDEESHVEGAEDDVENSTQEYNYFNDLLKDELPKLFALERRIHPATVPILLLYAAQHLLHAAREDASIAISELLRPHSGRRGGLQQEARRHPGREAEKLSIVKFKTSGQKRPPKYGPKPAGAITAGPSAAGDTSATTPRIGYQRQSDVVENPPPPYTATAASPAHAACGAMVRSPRPLQPSRNHRLQSPSPRTSARPLDPPRDGATALCMTTCSQAEGDLEFPAGETIEIITRTANEKRTGGPWKGQAGEPGSSR